MGSYMVSQTPTSDDLHGKDGMATKLPEGWLPGWPMHPSDNAGRRLLERAARTFGYVPFFMQVTAARSDFVFRPLRDYEPREPEPVVTEEYVTRFRQAAGLDSHDTHDEEAA